MGALQGVRILDMTQYEAGTSCTQWLGWLGADVVKVESPGRGDPGRGVGLQGFSQYFQNYNTNKRSITLDLANPAGRDLLLRMVPHYDAFVENYGPGVMEKLNIGYDVMKEINPGIIYGRLKGFGLSGPYSGYKSYDWVAQAAAGAFAVTGYADTPPTMPGPTIGDSGTGLQMALAITAAYVEKLRTGEGQFIEIAMQEAVTMFMRTQGLANWGKAVQPRTGSHGAPPTGVYRCAGGGPNDYLFIMVVTSRMWDTLCAVIGKPELIDDPRFVTGIERIQNGPALRAEIEEWTSQRSKYDAMRELADAGVPCSATLDHLDLFNDPHLKEREFIQTVEHPTWGQVTLMRNPVRMPGVDPLRAAPDLGAHTDEVLAADLGLSAEELADLRASGVTDMAQVAAD